MNTTAPAKKAPALKATAPKTAPAPKPVTPKTPMYYVEGQKDKKTDEFCHVYAGHPEDPLGRTPEVQRAYAEKMLKICRKIYPDLTFTLIYRNDEGVETEVNSAL